jgi:hypothetical protein
MIIAVDPGPEYSAYVCLDGMTVGDRGKIPNEDMLQQILDRRGDGGTLVVEQIAAMGMTVGAEVFETVFWSGRFVQAWSGDFDRVKRREVKIHLCGSMKAKDANVRQVLLDRYGPGKAKAVGLKRSPGPLYGFSKDLWSALAVGITWIETRGKKPF